MFAISTASFVSILAFASSLAVVVQAAGPRPECSATYDVLQGDTCSSIGATLKLSTTEIKAMNPNINCDDVLPAGAEELCIKQHTPTCANSVPATETTCNNLAYQYSITPVLFVAFNDDVNNECTNLVVDQLYCVSVATGGIGP